MEGYAKLAQLMGDDHTDGHFLIFQKFESLSAQNLLYLQAELINLQEDLGFLVKKDMESSDPEKLMYTRDWVALSSSNDRSQWEKWLEVCRKLKEYYEAIAQHRMIASLPAPNTYDLKFLQQWLERPNMGNNVFVGGDCDIYETHNAHGLVTLASRGREVDAMTTMLVNVLPNIYHRAVVNPLHKICGRWLKKPAAHPQCTRPEDASAGNGNAKTITPKQTDLPTSLPRDVESLEIEANIFFYRDSHIYRIAAALGTLISSLIPIAAIIILSIVHDMTARLGIVCAFTAVFSVSLSLVTEGRRVEIFAATAAFASVQVVFVGSTNQGKAN